MSTREASRRVAALPEGLAPGRRRRAGPHDGTSASTEAFAALLRELDAAAPRTLRWTAGDADGEVVPVASLRLLPLPEDRDAVVALLHERSFRPVALAPWRRAPAASDWYGVDGRDGSLLHVCLQRRLVLGTPARGWVPLDEGCHPPVPHGADGALGRSRAMSRALALCERTLGGDTVTPPQGADEALGSVPMEETFGALFGSRAAALLEAATGGDAAALRRRLLAVGPDRPLRERAIERLRRARCRLAALNRAGPRLPLLAGRDRAGPTLVLAVIGSDGSGKSSVSRWLAETLDAVFGARFIYFGTGDGPGSPLRRALVGLRHRSRFRTAPSPLTGGGDAEAVPRRTVASAPVFLRLIWAAVVAWERVGKMRALGRARAAGFVVVTDRYPQNERAGIHDGPRIGDLIDARAGGIAAALARFERVLYARLARRVPDQVLLLDVPLEIARRRRPEEPAAELERRIGVARSLRYGDAPRRVLDASEPLAHVKAEALRTALEALSRERVPTLRERHQRSGEDATL